MVAHFVHRIDPLLIDHAQEGASVDHTVRVPEHSQKLDPGSARTRMHPVT